MVVKDYKMQLCCCSTGGSNPSTASAASSSLLSASMSVICLVDFQLNRSSCTHVGSCSLNGFIVLARSIMLVDRKFENYRDGHNE